MDKKNDLKNALAKLEETLDLYMVKKAPFSIPDNIKDLIVQFAPYLTILGVILGIPVVLTLFGFGGFFYYFPGFGTSRFSFFYQLSTVVLAVTLVLEAMAIPGLFKREKKAWKLLYYAALVWVVYNLVRFDLLGLIVGGLLVFYILFQVKEYYK